MGTSQSKLNSLTAEQIADYVGKLGDGEMYAGYVKGIKANDVDGKCLARIESDESFKKFLAGLGIESYVHEQKLLSEWNAAKQQGNGASSQSEWALTPSDQVAAWRAVKATYRLEKLPIKPFPITTDACPRYELTGQFVERKCFALFEGRLQEASKIAEDQGRAPAVSVLGPKGAGKSVFFRYYCSKNCTERLVVYVPDAGTDVAKMYGKMMQGLIFGLQCLDTQEAQDLLAEVMALPVDANLDLFWTKWDQWCQRYEICGNAFIVIDQLKRKGELFQNLCRDPYLCGAYILVSSTGILHHHNVSDVYEQLKYYYPVDPTELASFDTEHKLIGEMPTMMGAFTALADCDSGGGHYVKAARKHYQSVKTAKHLEKLLALIQSEQSREAINGVIWDEVVDSNYLWVDDDKMVKAPFPEYVDELLVLLQGDKVNYKKTLIALLSDKFIVNEVGNAALGVHIKALLDITWRDHKVIAWSSAKKLGYAGPNRGQGRKSKTFKDLQPKCFHGDIPTAEDLKGLNWTLPVYFKPTKTNYPGFDMFVLEKLGSRYCMHAIQVTVQNARDHGVQAFDNTYLTNWNSLLKANIPCADVEWRFYMLTPESHPGEGCPESVFSSNQIPIFQVGFRDLLPTDDDPCGVRTVSDFVGLLESKRQAQAADLQERKKEAKKARINSGAIGKQ